MQFWRSVSSRKSKCWGGAACDLNVADLDFSPAQREANKSFPDKIRQQLQVLRDLNLLEFLGSGSYRVTLALQLSPPQYGPHPNWPPRTSLRILFSYTAYCVPLLSALRPDSSLVLSRFASF